ncbi:hypothetical protein IBT47_17450 [Erwinia sp. S43]|nr:hypothetical protein [Erwinia sp. S43]
MKAITSSLHRYRVIKPGRKVNGRNSMLFMATLLSLPAMADEIKDNSDNYIGGYQSYFHDDLETPKSTVKSAVAANGKTATPGNTSSATSVASASDGATAAAGGYSTPARTLEDGADYQSAAAPGGQSVHASAAAAGSVPDKGGVLLSKSNEVSLLRLRQDEPPVHWNSVGRNMEAGGLHGNIGTQIEIDDARRSNNEHNGGKFKYATLQAFLRHDEMPNWYFGFYNAREDSYKGQFSNQHYSGTNTINEVFVGHIFETWRGNIGAEVMGGSESAGKRWKSRFKLWQDLRLSDRWSIAGYAFGEFQPQGTEPGNGDLEKLIFETEPALQYRVNPDLGLYLRPFYSYNRQEREQWGDIIEREWKVSAGLWKNWYPLLTSLYVGVGQKKTTNASDSYELFYDGRYQYVGGTLSYPIVDELRLYGEFKAKFTKEAGAWTTAGYSWTPFTVVGAVYNF